MNRRVLIACAAAPGLVGSHVIDYAVAFRDPLRRAAILHATGHSYFSRAVAIAAAAAMVAVAGSAVLGFRPRRSVLGWRATALRLCGIQIAGFVLLEVGERVAVGAHVTDLFGALGVAGIALQIVVACAVAALLVGVKRVAHAFATAAPRFRVPRTTGTWRFRFQTRGPRIVFASGLAARAPPLVPR